MKIIRTITKEKDNSYLSLLSERNFLLETLATIISRFGDGIDTIAFSLLVYEITGSTLLVATLFGVNGIPNIIFGMISGVACKYISDKKIMVICDFGRFIGVGLIALLYLSGNLAIWHLYVITFLNSSFEAFRSPANTSIFPKIVPKEKMEHALAFSSSGCKIAEVIGLAIAPVIINFTGFSLAILIDSITFLVCGILIMGLKIKDEIKANIDVKIKDYFVDLKEGFIYIKNDGLILNIVIFAGVINALVVPFNSLEAPYVKKVLGVGSEALSIMNISLLVGMIITTMVTPKIKEKVKNKNMFIMGGIIMGIAYFNMSLLGVLEKEFIYIGLTVNSFILGLGIVILNFPIQVSMMKKIPKEFLPRVSATMNAVALCAVPVSAFIIGIISQIIEIKTFFMVCGIITVVLFILQNLNKVMDEYNMY